MAIRLADTARPNNYVDAEHKGTFPVAYAEDVWFEDGTRLSEKSFDGQSIQKEELPLASADELGNIYQYVGETGTYKNGHFYKCIFNSSVYSWSEIKMVEKPVVYSETVPDINAYETGSIVCYTGEDSGSFEKGHLYQKNETSFTYYYWTFYRDSAKTQPYIFYTQEETLANGVKVYKANPTTGEGDISLVGSIANYQEFSFFVSGSSFVQYFHPEADTSKNRTITEGDWVDIGGGSKLDNVFIVKDSDGAATLAVSQRTFTGTQAEWDALTTAEKKTYGQVNITDDESSTEGIKEYIRKWNELEPVPSVRIGNGIIGWTQGDLTQDYTMEHDGIVNVFLDENTHYYVVTDLSGSTTQIYAPTVHASASSAMSLFLKKGYKIRLSTNSYSGLSIQYYVNRD